MLNVAVAGASGYTGAELCRLISSHPGLKLAGIFVSARSQDQGKALSELYGSLATRVELKLRPLHDPEELLSCGAQAVFLATDHKVSHDLAPALVKGGCRVFDLSGAFRLKDPAVFARYYGFEHQHPELLEDAVYALAEFTTQEELRRASVIALPGCYPTASQLALKPLLDCGLLERSFRPVINAVSGVSGSGRKAKLASSFCEVSLNAYGVFTHRHLPEITSRLGMEVIFNPHLGSFKRGILATITARLVPGTTAEAVREAYESAYAHKPLIRLKQSLPRLQDVQGLPFCDLGWQCGPEGYIVICSAIDNLLKGAAAQALQVLNLHYGYPETAGLF